MTKQKTGNKHHHRRYSKAIRDFYKSKKNRAYTGIVLSIFTVAFFSFFTIRPTLVTIAGLLKEIEDKKTVAQKLEEKIETLNQAQNEYQANQAKLDLLDQALPVSSEFSLLVRQMEFLVLRNNLTFNSISFKGIDLKQTDKKKSKDSPGTVTQGKVREIFFSVKVTGEYSQLLAFLNDLYRFRRLIAIDSLSLAPEFESADKNKLLSLETDLITYYYPTGN